MFHQGQVSEYRIFNILMLICALDNKEYIVELVNMEKSKKVVIVCNSEEEQEMIVSKSVAATLNHQ